MNYYTDFWSVALLTLSGVTVVLGLIYIVMSVLHYIYEENDDELV